MLFLPGALFTQTISMKKSASEEGGGTFPCTGQRIEIESCIMLTGDLAYSACTRQVLCDLSYALYVRWKTKCPLRIMPSSSAIMYRSTVTYE